MLQKKGEIQFVLECCRRRDTFSLLEYYRRRDTFNLLGCYRRHGWIQFVRMVLKNGINALCWNVTEERDEFN